MESYLQEKKYTVIFLKRDPRDQIVSLYNHYLNITCYDPNFLLLSTSDERLLYMIESKARKLTTNFKGWRDSSICCNLEFEKLMGPHGGAASDEDVLIALKKLVKALDLTVSDKRLMQVYKKCFGQSWNFFKGKVGSWRDYFKEEHIAAIKREIGDLLIELGYEENYDW